MIHWISNKSCSPTYCGQNLGHPKQQLLDSEETSYFPCWGVPFFCQRRLIGHFPSLCFKPKGLANIIHSKIDRQQLPIFFIVPANIVFPLFNSLLYFKTKPKSTQVTHWNSLLTKLHEQLLHLSPFLKQPSSSLIPTTTQEAAIASPSAKQS